MPRARNKFLKCVYKIYFINNNKIYIGSSIRWPYRKREHIYKLKTQKHHNIYLQRATNKYGIKNIKVEPVEFCKNISDLKKKEQYWIDFYDSKNPCKGFNLVKMVEHNGTTGYKFTQKQKEKCSIVAKKRMQNVKIREKISNTILKTLKQNPEAYGGHFNPKIFIFYSPKSKKTKIYNLCKFCRKHKLIYNKMLKVHSGDMIQYKGWKKNLLRVNLIKKHFIFKSPKGKKIKLYGLRKFCIKNNLHYRTMCNIHRGIGISCQGWKKY